MKVDCISDLHGYFPKLEGGDLLIVAGDLTARDELELYDEFYEWLDGQEYEMKVVVAGNHDNKISADLIETMSRCYYLEDSRATFRGLKIWGSPWTSQFTGINPHCCAFTMRYGTDTDYWLGNKWEEIPKDTDILITHSPPYGIFDKTARGELAGSRSLLVKVAEIKPILHVFGHIHEQGGKEIFIPWGSGTYFINASQVNEKYLNVHKPITICL